MANGWVINQKASAQFLLDVARGERYYFKDAESVKRRFLERYNAACKKLGRDMIESLPSRGGGKRVG
jgi:hypothetical protein